MSWNKYLYLWVYYFPLIVHVVLSSKYFWNGEIVNVVTFKQGTILFQLFIPKFWSLIKLCRFTEMLKHFKQLKSMDRLWSKKVGRNQYGLKKVVLYFDLYKPFRLLASVTRPLSIYKALSICIVSTHLNI